MEKVAAWKKQPVKGLWWIIVSILLSILYMQVVAPALGISYADAGMNYPAMFFFWAFAWISLFEYWPFGHLKQPWTGLASAVLCWILSVVSWGWLSRLMDPYAAVALVMYALFPLFLLAWFSDYLPAAMPMPQPLKGIFLSVACVVIAWVVYTQIGAIPQMWLYFMPMFFAPFFDGWPVADPKYNRLIKLVFWTVMFLALTWLFDYVHVLAGAPMSGALGSDFECLVWAGMTPLYVFEMAGRGKQPSHGILLTVVTYVLTAVFAFLYWRVLRLPEWWASTWVFVWWVWIIVVQFLPYPWPSEPPSEA